MADTTRDRIKEAALRQFSERGYEAVSVSDIAGELGMTKGALYRHFENKRAILDSIVEDLQRKADERDAEFSVPERGQSAADSAYRRAALTALADYGKSAFRFWTEDEQAAPFRKLLTLEQYRDPELGKLYQRFFVSGQMSRSANLFHRLGLPKPWKLAVDFCAPLFILLSVYDGSENRQAVAPVLDGCMDSLVNTLSKEL
jgi:AcrR family transcriptional regulator